MKTTIKNLKKVYDYGKEYRKNLYAFTIITLLFIFVSVIYPMFTARQLTALTNEDYKSLIIVTLIVFGFDILNGIKTLVIKRNTQIFFRGVFKKLQLAVSKEILKIKVKELDNNSSGVFIERLNEDCKELSHIFTIGMGNVTSILTNIGIFAAVFIINKMVFFFYIFAASCIAYLNIVKVRAVNEKDKELRRKREENMGLTAELVRGVRDIKMLNASSSFLKTLEKSINEVSEKVYAMRNTHMNYNFAITVVDSIFEVLLVIILIYLLINHSVTISLAIVLYSYRNNILGNLMYAVANLLEELKDFNLSCNRVFSLLESKEFNKEQFGSKHLEKVNGDFEFKDVVFGYNKDRTVLNKLSFNVKANETVGFVGKSGSGKTTIFNLLCKMYDIDDGEIKIDGYNIDTLDEESIRGSITIISQNPYIFNMSIRDNLKLVKDDLTDKEMIEACKIACLDDFVNTLPNKYDTVIGEGGVTLSGGERQRLAIARAFIQKTEIILFDEATSALDNETQSKIATALNNLKREYTILIIAHRFSTIVNCDKIYYISNGKVIDSGTHSELLKTCNEYKHLYESEIKYNK